MNQQSHHFTKSFAVLTLIVKWQQENGPENHQVWNAFFLMSEKLLSIKERKSLNPRLQSSSSSLFFENLTISDKPNLVPEDLTAPHIQCLPNEILYQIFEYLENFQFELSQASKACKRWSHVATPLLYKAPHLRTKKSIRKLFKTVELTPNCSFATKISSLQFGFSMNGSLVDDRSIIGIEGILMAHSCLYRMILQDRNSTDGVHPIFFEMTKLFPSLKFIRETFPKDQETSGASSLFRDSHRPGFTMNDYILTRLQRCSRRVHDVPEWQYINPIQIQPICIMLLELFQSDKPWLSQIAPGALRNARQTVLDKIKYSLNLISAVLLLQVQYVTVSSQMLLDAYCLIYYEALDVSGGLNCNLLDKVFNKAREQTIAYPYVREAKCIYECIAQVYKQNITTVGSSPAEALGPVDMAKIQSTLTSFPPAGVNSETVEFLEQQLETTLFNVITWQDDELDELNKWKQWMDVIIRWHRASKQMEPVKELLRGNMTKIDALRGVQRRYGIVFMD